MAGVQLERSLKTVARLAQIFGRDALLLEDLPPALEIHFDHAAGDGAAIGQVLGALGERLVVEIESPVEQTHAVQLVGVKYAVRLTLEQASLGKRRFD